MSVRLQTIVTSVVALGIGSFLLVLAAQQADEINFAAVAKLLGLATGFVLLVIFVLGGLALLSDRVSTAVRRRMDRIGIKAKETSRRTDPFLILIPIVLVFLIETAAAESDNLTAVARGVLAITAISGAVAHMKFENGRMRWRAASLALVLSGPITFWLIVFADKLSIADFANDCREGVLANAWDYLNELAAVSSSVEVAAAIGSAFLMVAGVAWVLWPWRRGWLLGGQA